MYAVIRTGGKQYRVREGDRLRLEKLPGEPGSEIEFDQVLMVGEGDKVEVGRPCIEGSTVTAAVREHGRGRKIRIIKFRRRKHYMRTQGHRQDYTEVEIVRIGAAAGSSAGSTTGATTGSTDGAAAAAAGE